MGGIIGGIASAGAARSAAKSQERAAQQDLAFQRETRDLIFDRLDPFYQSGVGAQNALAFELGLGERPMVGGTAPQIETFTETMSMGGPAQPMGAVDALRASAGNAGEFQRLAYGTGPNATPAAPQTQQTRQRFRVGGQTFDTMEDAQAFANANRTGGTAYQGFQATPGFQFQLQQGQDAVNALAGARGGVNSGRTLQDLATFNQGLANQEYGNFLNRLTGMAGQGMGAAGLQANAATNAASGVSNALGGIGNARAAGAVGMANALNQGIGNQLAINQYQRGVNGTQQGGLASLLSIPRGGLFNGLV